MKRDPNKSRLKVYIPLGIVIIAVITGAVFWYRDYSRYITTDDAHVEANNVTISSKILGRIAALYVDEGDSVKKRQLLVAIDSSDLLAQKNQALALRDQALSNLKQAETKFNSDKESLKVVEINSERARDDFDRARKQYEGGVITQEQNDHIRKAYEAASAEVDAAKAMLTVSNAQINSAAAAVRTAEAQIKVLETQIGNTKLYSPEDGVIAKRWLLPGDIVQPGQSVFTVTNDKEKWLSVYLEETKIAAVHDGQEAKFTIDAFPHIRFYGKVFLVGSNTASVFSLIPANNASGNFTKVTQRVPVKISIDSTDDHRNILSYNILNGMSAVVKIKRK